MCIQSVYINLLIIKHIYILETECDNGVWYMTTTF